MTDDEKKIKECRFVLAALRTHESCLVEAVADPALTDDEKAPFQNDLDYGDQLITLYENELEMLTGEREHR